MIGVTRPVVLPRIRLRQRDQSTREHRWIVTAGNHQWHDHLEHCAESADNWTASSQSLVREGSVRRHDHFADLEPVVDGWKSTRRYRARSSRSKDSL